MPNKPLMPFFKSVITLLAFVLLLVSLPLAADSDGFRSALEKRSESLRRQGKIFVGDRQIYAAQFVHGIYQLNEYRPLWDATAQAALMDAVEDLKRDGLTPADYRFPEMKRYFNKQSKGELSVDERLDLDFLLSEALVRALYNLAYGKVDPVALDSNINFSRPLTERDFAPILLEHIKAGKILELLDIARPKQPMYKALKAGLGDYRHIQQAGGWKQLPAGKTLKPGESDPRIPLLRRRLEATGDYQNHPNHSDQLFDQTLKSAVEGFQQRHGLDVDGAVGPATLAALNVSVEERIDQIRVNLERLRWYLHEAEGEYLLVDIAGFQAYWVKEGTVIWNEIIQVGKHYTSTPVFKDEIRYLDFNPTWTIPPGIIKRSIRPNLLKDAGYLKKKGYDLLTLDGKPVDAETVDWASINGFPYLVRQPPGPDNAMGLVKFMFPNPHFVFLHDTNHRELFDRTTRTFSSGCIRIRKPFDLAEMLLEGQDGWDRQRIDEVVASGKTTRVNLDKRMRIIIAYTTAAARDGKLHFKEDIYKRDSTVLKTLDGTFQLRQQDTK